MEILQWLQEWYLSNCDGDWEHMFGITIETLDNPGWQVKIDLVDTPLEDKPFKGIINYVDDNNWINCIVKDRVFDGGSDPQKLKEILIIFKSWVEQ